MKTLAPAKVADIRYRVEVKALSGVVVYKTVSSDGKCEYETTLVNGKVSSCTCPAHQKSGVTCYVIRDVLAKELEVQDRKRADEKAMMDALAAEIAADALAVAPVAVVAPTRVNRSSLNNRELRFENGIPMR